MPHESTSNCPPESVSDCPLESDSALDGDELPREMFSDIYVFEEESDEDYAISGDDGQEFNNESSENKHQDEVTIGSTIYYAQPFQCRLKRRNILTKCA